MMKAKLVFLALKKEAPHGDYLRYGSTFSFPSSSFCQNKIPDPKLLPKKTDQECLKSLPQGTYLTNFFLPSFLPSLLHTPGLGTTSPARSSILSCFLAI